MSPSQVRSAAAAVVVPAPEGMRHVMAAYPTGVALVAAMVEKRIVGMTVNSFTSVSLEPPLVSVSFARTSSTWPTLRRASRWGISLLDDTDPALLPSLSRPAPHRFDGVRMRSGSRGSMFLEDAAATLGVELQDEIDAGDHVLTLLRVHELGRDTTRTPLVFHDSGARRLALASSTSQEFS